MDLPLGLTTALESGNCILFVGAGVGYNMQGSDGAAAPTGHALARELAEKYKLEIEGSAGLADVAEVVEIRHGRAKLVSFIEKRLSGLEPDADLRWLMSLTWRAVFTTNYDDALERCYQLNDNPTQRPVTIATNSETTSWDPRFEVPIFHLHGSLMSDIAKQSILITQRDYARFREKRRMLFDHFKLSFAGTPILYIGYSNRDPNWRMVTSELRAEFEPNEPPQSFRVVPSTPDLDREILAAQGIVTLDGDLPQFRAIIELQLGNLRVEPHRLDAIRAKVPSDLHKAFESSPAAVSRLLNAWDYVNQADFSGQPNTQSFHRGDRPNWSLLGQGISFERDLEKPLVDRLLDFATNPKASLATEIALGPAGYGTTTLLMAVAAWFARNRAGRTYFLRPGMAPLPADIEFASKLSSEPVVFVIDDAADHLETLAEITQLLRSLPTPAFLLLGERLNEWRQRRSTLPVVEHALEPLSDDEIVRLLQSLSTTNSLGRLAALGTSLQFAAIKQRNQQQLLVTMREVTEGRAFDAIIEDEYRSIGSALARRLYAFICAFSRCRALARDLMCSNALDIAATDLYPLLSDELAGTVAWEVVDDARGIDALRARHPTIADIVWERCLDRLEREELLIAALSALNLTFGVDAKAFEAFTRDDGSIDSLRTLESKTRFFEDACRKDPSNPYVRQHYARMLRREGRYELALSQIDRALEMAPNARVLTHSRGVILRDLALSSESHELGLRRIAQSEAEFDRAIQRNPQDEYSYQSLAELYLDWAKQSKSPSEAMTYVTKAQETINTGLLEVRNREGLLIVASNIERYLEDTPARIESLRMALDEAPLSGVVSYLLGNVLRRERDFDGAIEVLKPGVESYPDDPNLAWAYALSVYEGGGSSEEAAAILHLARLKGEREPRFVATLGGMLVLSGDFDEAERVWKQSANRNFSFQDRTRAYFVPIREGRPVILSGRVAQIGSGYAFIASVGMPDFFCHGSQYSGLSLRRGQTVSFDVAFSARGPVAGNIRLNAG